MKQKFSRKKKIIKNLFKVNEKNNSSVLGINQTAINKLLANTAVISIVTLYFEHGDHFHISDFTYHLRYYIIIDHS